MNSPTGVRYPFVQALEVTRTLQERLAFESESLLEKNDSGRQRLLQPDSVEIKEEDVKEEVTKNREDPKPKAPLTEDWALDSGSEEEDELTVDQMQEILGDLETPPEETQADIDYERDSFMWSEDFATFAGVREAFVEEVGSKIDGISPLGIFCQLWDQPLMQTIVDETNRYAWQTIAKAMEPEKSISSHSRMHNWVETSVSEIYRLLAVMILMGVCVMGRIDEYWSTGILGMPGFRSIMPRNRYLLLMSFLHFVDDDCILDEGNQRKVAKISPVISYLNNKFKTAYSPCRELYIDESLLLWKGRSSWVHCIRTKAARFGIRTYELCEAVSGYVLKIMINTGKTTATVPVAGLTSTTAKVVFTLMEDYLGKGYTLFMDNFYNSVDLCRYLKSLATDVVGTLNRRRQNTPTAITNLDERNMVRGSVVGRHCGDVSVLAWKDEKLVTTISTYHNAELVQLREGGRTFYKPRLVEDYNKYMGGVYLRDTKLSMYLLERKRGTKLYIKLFKRLLDISVLNSYIIYTSNIGQGRKMTHRQFRYALAEELCEKYGDFTKPPAQLKPICGRLNKNVDHFPELCMISGERKEARQGRFKRLRCVNCLANKKRTMCRTFCSHCKVYLCVGPCWSEYHSSNNIT